MGFSRRRAVAFSFGKTPIKIEELDYTYRENAVAGSS
jgi:hypothetical protein